MAVAQAGDMIYMIGGTDIGSAGEGQTVFFYDIDTNRWSPGTPMSTDRWQFGATYVGNHLDAIGGLYSDSTTLSAEAYDAAQKCVVDLDDSARLGHAQRA